MSIITDLYRQLFGREGTSKGSDIDMAEHGRVGGVSTGQPFKYTSIIDPSSGTSLNSLIDTLQELSQRLAPLGGAMEAGNSRLRVTQTAVPSTAVTGPITSAQSIAEKAAGGILYAEKIALTNLTATQANINNCIA